MATEATVQIEIPRTGQKIRNLSVSALQTDGTIATVLMQVVALADDQGQILNLDGLAHLDELLWVMKEVRGLLKLLVEATTHTSVARTQLDRL